MIEVILTFEDFTRAHDCAWRRLTESHHQGLHAAKRYQRGWAERLRDDVVGACGELAFAKVVGANWDEKINTFHSVADIADVVEVRATTRDAGHLLVRPDDPPERWYYLVTGDPPVMTIRGGILGSAARRNEWLQEWNAGPAVWAVPQSALTPLRQLPKG